ncbi:MAG: DNA-3-methyladenine glycosylase 2 [Ruminococcaceae bacterium]|nr:DNA-3-methyladenine glycosylase 2 [Oscillospiraceae bacterium]
MLTDMKNEIIIDCPSDFSLAETLISGQCFRWTQREEYIVGTAFSVTVKMRQDGGRLTIYGDESENAVERWRHYLDLDTDYASIREEVLALEPRLTQASKRTAGLHILNQEPWEALCSFIISQNNNIPRIRGIIERLCELCGCAAENDGYAFPPPETVSKLTLEQLASIGCGYRAPYIIAAAQAVCDKKISFDELREIPVEQAREKLLSLHGVGPKVADCMLLYGLHRLECFPKDVWIKRALEGEFKDTPLVGSPYAGVAQQYIFEYIRAI